MKKTSHREEFWARSGVWEPGFFFIWPKYNKHSESIAKAVQVPYRPQQILKRHKSYNSRSKGPKSNFKSINQNTTGKSLGNVRKLNFCKVLSQKQFKYQIAIEYLKRLQRKVRKTKFEQRAITPVKIGQARQNLNLTCFISRQIHISNFKSIFQTTAEKSPEN